MLPLRMLVPLILTFLLRDADSTCPEDLLTLDPPKIIGEYEETVLVNCSNIDTDHYGMQWRAGSQKSEEEDERSYVEWGMTLSNWDLTAECSVMWNETTKCTKKLEITVYKNPEMVIISKHPSVEGTLYELQCDILNVAPVQNLNVTWYKDSEIIKTDSFNNAVKTPVNQTSTLTVNITRTEHGAQFKCEAQLYFGPDGPQTPNVSDIHHVSVHYAPELKNKTYEIQTLYVNEDDDVSLSCEAEANPPPVFTWTSDGENILESTNNLNITQGNTSATYICTASNYLGNVTQEFYVTFEQALMGAPTVATTTPGAKTKKGCPLTLMPAEAVVKFGDPVSVNCSSSETDVSMGWEAPVGGKSLDAVSTVTWTVDKLEQWDIEPMCFADVDPTVYTTDQYKVTPVITLYKTPDSVLVSALTRGPIQEGSEYQLRCEIINVAPVNNLVVKWYQDNKMVQKENYTDSSRTPRDMTSVFSGTAERDHNGALFRCEAELHLGPKGPEHPPSVASNYTADVQYKPRMQNCASNQIGVEPNFTLSMLSCQADGNPRPTVQWYYQGNPINANEPLNRAQSGEYTAELDNILGKTNTSVNIKIEYSPSFACDKRYEVRDGDEAQVKCDPEGEPKPFITWYKDGKKMKTPQHWTKHHSGQYDLKATNKHGTADHTLYLDVLYAPVFTPGHVTKEVTAGENVTFDCHADGNPTPVIHWNYTFAANVKETTGGRQKNVSVISIREATSTNAGVYICVATNRVGSVRRSVTLNIKGKNTGGSSTILWLVVIILIAVILILLIVIFLKRSKNHGQYSFVPNRAKDDSGIPMTSKSDGVNA